MSIFSPRFPEIAYLQFFNKVEYFSERPILSRLYLMFSQDYIGNTLLVTLLDLNAGIDNPILVKLEEYNHAGLAMDTSANSMIRPPKVRADNISGGVPVTVTSGKTGTASARVVALLSGWSIPDNRHI